MILWFDNLLMILHWLWIWWLPHLQSAIYTGVYGFSIAVAWLLLGLLLALAAFCKLCCCRREKVQEPRSSFYYWLPRLLVLLLSLFAMYVYLSPITSVVLLKFLKASCLKKILFIVACFSEHPSFHETSHVLFKSTHFLFLELRRVRNWEMVLQN